MSRRKQEHSVPPVELEAAVESEDEDNTEAQEDNGSDELREEERRKVLFLFGTLEIIFANVLLQSTRRSVPSRSRVLPHLPRCPQRRSAPAVC
jgi:hypothetical protein